MAERRDLTVLMVMADARRREVLRLALRMLGVSEVHALGDGGSALHLLQTTAVDALVCEADGFPVDGLTLTRFVRHSEQSPDWYMPVIVLLRPQDPTLEQPIRDAGANAVLRRPVAPTELYRSILTHVRRPPAFVRDGRYFGPERRTVPRRSEASGGWRDRLRSTLLGN